jgi:hypothetical protein
LGEHRQHCFQNSDVRWRRIDAVKFKIHGFHEQLNWIQYDQTLLPPTATSASSVLFCHCRLKHCGASAKLGMTPSATNHAFKSAGRHAQGWWSTATLLFHLCGRADLPHVRDMCCVTPAHQTTASASAELRVVCCDWARLAELVKLLPPSWPII